MPVSRIDIIIVHNRHRSIFQFIISLLNKNCKKAGTFLPFKKVSPRLFSVPHCPGFIKICFLADHIFSTNVLFLFSVSGIPRSLWIFCKNRPLSAKSLTPVCQISTDMTYKSNVQAAQDDYFKNRSKIKVAQPTKIVYTVYIDTSRCKMESKNMLSPNQQHGNIQIQHDG